MKEIEQTIDRVLAEQADIYPDLVFTKQVKETGTEWWFSDTQDHFTLPSKRKKREPLIYLYINGFLRGFGDCPKTVVLKGLRMIRERYGIRKPREDE